MEPIHRNLLEVNEEFLVSEAPADPLINALQARAVLTDLDMEQIRVLQPQGSRAVKRFLVHVLPHRGSQAFPALLESLQVARAQHVADLLLQGEKELRSQAGSSARLPPEHLKNPDELVRKLRANRDAIEESVNPEHVIYRLQQNGVLVPLEERLLADVKGQHSQTWSLLWGVLMQRGVKAYQAFMEALRQHGYSALSRTIEETRPSDYAGSRSSSAFDVDSNLQTTTRQIYNVLDLNFTYTNPEESPHDPAVCPHCRSCFYCTAHPHGHPHGLFSLPQPGSGSAGIFSQPRASPLNPLHYRRASTLGYASSHAPSYSAAPYRSHGSAKRGYTLGPLPGTAAAAVEKTKFVHYHGGGGQFDCDYCSKDLTQSSPQGSAGAYRTAYCSKCSRSMSGKRRNGSTLCDHCTAAVFNSSPKPFTGPLKPLYRRKSDSVLSTPPSLSQFGLGPCEYCSRILTPPRTAPATSGPRPIYTVSRPWTSPLTPGFCEYCSKAISQISPHPSLPAYSLGRPRSAPPDNASDINHSRGLDLFPHATARPFYPQRNGLHSPPITMPFNPYDCEYCSQGVSHPTHQLPTGHGNGLRTWDHAFSSSALRRRADILGSAFSRKGLSPAYPRLNPLQPFLSKQAWNEPLHNCRAPYLTSDLSPLKPTYTTGRAQYQYTPRTAHILGEGKRPTHMPRSLDWLYDPRWTEPLNHLRRPDLMRKMLGHRGKLNTEQERSYSLKDDPVKRVVTERPTESFLINLEPVWRRPMPTTSFSPMDDLPELRALRGLHNLSPLRTDSQVPAARSPRPKDDPVNRVVTQRPDVLFEFEPIERRSVALAPTLPEWSLLLLDLEPEWELPIAMRDQRGSDYFPELRRLRPIISQPTTPVLSRRRSPRMDTTELTYLTPRAGDVSPVLGSYLPPPAGDVTQRRALMSDSSPPESFTSLPAGDVSPSALKSDTSLEDGYVSAPTGDLQPTLRPGQGTMAQEIFLTPAAGDVALRRDSYIGPPTGDVIPGQPTKPEAAQQESYLVPPAGDFIPGQVSEATPQQSYLTPGAGDVVPGTLQLGTKPQQVYPTPPVGDVIPGQDSVDSAPQESYLTIPAGDAAGRRPVTHDRSPQQSFLFPPAGDVSAARPGALDTTPQDSFLMLPAGGVSRAPRPVTQEPRYYQGPPVGDYTVPHMAELTAPPLQTYRLPDVGDYSLPRAGDSSGPLVAEYSGPPVGDYTVPVAGDYRGPLVGEYTVPPAGDYTVPEVRDYTPPPVGDYSGPPARDFTPPPVRDFTPPPARDFTPPPVRDYSPPPVRDVTPPPVRDYSPPPVREITPPPVREITPPPPVREITPPPVREITPPPIRDYSPPPVREITPPPVVDYSPPPVREITPPPVVEYSPPPVRELTPPPVIEYSPPPVRELTPPPVIEYSPPPVRELTPPPVIEYSPPPVRELTPPPVVEYSPPPVRELTPPPVIEYSPPPVRELTPPPVIEYSPPPVRELTPPPVREYTPPPVRELTPPPEREPTPPPIREPTPPPVREPTPEPTPPPVREPTPEPTPEPSPEPSTPESSVHSPWPGIPKEVTVHEWASHELRNQSKKYPDYSMGYFYERVPTPPQPPPPPTPPPPTPPPPPPPPLKMTTLKVKQSVEYHINPDHPDSVVEVSRHLELADSMHTSALGPADVPPVLERPGQAVYVNQHPPAQFYVNPPTQAAQGPPPAQVPVYDTRGQPAMQFVGAGPQHTGTPLVNHGLNDIFHMTQDYMLGVQHHVETEIPAYEVGAPGEPKEYMILDPQSDGTQLTTVRPGVITERREAPRPPVVLHNIAPAQLPPTPPESPEEDVSVGVPSPEEDDPVEDWTPEPPYRIVRSPLVEPPYTIDYLFDGVSLVSEETEYDDRGTGGGPSRQYTFTDSHYVETYKPRRRPVCGRLGHNRYSSRYIHSSTSSVSDIDSIFDGLSMGSRRRSTYVRRTSIFQAPYGSGYSRRRPVSNFLLSDEDSLLEPEDLDWYVGGKKIRRRKSTLVREEPDYSRKDAKPPADEPRKSRGILSKFGFKKADKKPAEEKPVPSKTEPAKAKKKLRPNESGIPVRSQDTNQKPGEPQAKKKTSISWNPFTRSK